MFEKLGYILVATALIVVFFQIEIFKEEPTILEELSENFEETIYISVYHNNETTTYLLENCPTPPEESLIIAHILNPETPIEDPYDFELGTEGIKLQKEIILPHIAITQNKDQNDLIEDLCQKVGLEKDCGNNPENQFYKFTTQTFSEETELSRYNNYLGNIYKEDIENMLAIAANWLEEKIQASGQFKYEYYPSSDSYSDSYNILRHIGSTYALLLYYGYNDSTDSAINYFLQYLTEEDNSAYITYNDKTKLGGAALAVITLEEAYKLTENQEYAEVSEKLAEFILEMQKEDGSFKNYYPEEKPDSQGTYEIYGAESNLALVRIFKRTGNEKYLEALENSFTYTQTYFDENPSTMMISWDTEAFSELYYLTNEEKYANLAYQMADWIIEERQYTEENTPYWDYIGGFRNGSNPTSGSTATYSECVGEALQLAIFKNDEEKTEKYQESLKSSLKFLANLQYREDNSFYLENPQEALGGFRESMYDNTQRIDYAQHAISAILKALGNEVY